MNTSTVLIILIGGAIVVFGGFFATVVLFQYFLNKSRAAAPPEQSKTEQPELNIPKAPEPIYRAYFGFRQIVPLLAIGATCLAFTLALLPQLSAEPAFRFSDAGEPANYAGASLVIAGSLLVQLLFITIGWFVGTAIKSFINRLAMPESAGRQSQKVISVAANMIVLPQLIAAYISFDIFIYDVFSFHLLPVWIFAIMTMVIGGIFLCWRFYNIMHSKIE